MSIEQKAVAMVARYAELTAAIKDRTARIHDAFEDCWSRETDEKGSKALHISDWYKDVRSGRKMASKRTMMRVCEHCCAAHGQIVERKEIRRSLAAVKRWMTVNGSKLLCKTES